MFVHTCWDIVDEDSSDRIRAATPPISLCVEITDQIVLLRFPFMDFKDRLRVFPIDVRWQQALAYASPPIGPVLTRLVIYDSYRGFVESVPR